jgi:pseudouridine synthase
MAQMRLQRFLAQAGVASRRQSEELIVDGKVRVNGRVVTELGTKVDPDRDKVVVSGRRLVAAQQRHLVLCKPKGYVTTLSDPEGRPTVMDLLGERARGLYPVGRLDFNTDGVLLLTNDGDLAHALMHPSGGIEKTYHAKLHGMVTAEEIQRLRDGVVLPEAPAESARAGRERPRDAGRKTAPATVRLLAETGRNTWLEITISEGRNRQIHRMCEAIGHQLLKLSRVAYGPVKVRDMKPGDWRPLAAKELEELREGAGAKSTHVKKRAPSTRAQQRAQRSEAPHQPRATPRHRRR